MHAQRQLLLWEIQRKPKKDSKQVISFLPNINFTLEKEKKEQLAKKTMKQNDNFKVSY